MRKGRKGGREGRYIPALLTRAKSIPLHSAPIFSTAASMSEALVTSKGRGVRMPVREGGRERGREGGEMGKYILVAALLQRRPCLRLWSRPREEE